MTVADLIEIADTVSFLMIGSPLFAAFLCFADAIRPGKEMQ